MKFINEFRNAELTKRLSDEIHKIVTKDWTIMEICGGQTHSIMKFGLEDFLPSQIKLVHGPGCPVCVTPIEMIDKAIAIASRDDVIFTTFGDMMRVPGSKSDLLSVKANGFDVRMVYSPLNAVSLAKANPHKKVVFFAVGFETTAPANAMAVLEAQRLNLKNFSILCSHVLVPPAIEAILSNPNSQIQAFLAAGHVCTVMGYDEYIPLSERYKIPIVVTGFEPVDILQGIYLEIKQLEGKKYFVENQYSRVVTQAGNIQAKKILEKVFVIADRAWRGIGIIPKSGYKLSEEFIEYDAEKLFDVESVSAKESSLCIAGQVLQGTKKPIECNSFNKECTPEHPLGAPMVSSEGACAAYFHYKKIVQ